MSAMSDYLENKLVDHIFRATAFTQPANVYIALFTTSGSLANLEAGTLTGEVTGGTYSRVTVATADTDWNGTHGNTTGNSSGTTGLTDNAAAITFPTATASWGTVAYVAIMDAATSGNVLFFGSLDSNKTIDSGDTFKFNAGNLDITFA